MDQRGYILEIVDDRTAKFKMQRHSACASCGKCIGSQSSESQDIIVEVDNPVGALAGQYVEVSMEQIDVMRAIFIVYGIPLLALLVGATGSFYAMKAVGVVGAKQEVVSFFVGILFTAIAYLGIKTKDSKFRDSRKYMPTVTRILDGDGAVQAVE